MPFFSIPLTDPLMMGRFLFLHGGQASTTSERVSISRLDRPKEDSSFLAEARKLLRLSLDPGLVFVILYIDGIMRSEKEKEKERGKESEE